MTFKQQRKDSANGSLQLDGRSRKTVSHNANSMFMSRCNDNRNSTEIFESQLAAFHLSETSGESMKRACRRTPKSRQDENPKVIFGEG